MKLSDYAKQIGVSYQTALNHFNKGIINGAYQLPTGTIIVPNNFENNLISDNKTKVILYARTSSSQNKKLLDTQLDRLREYAIAKGYTIISEIKEIGSGLNDSRKQLSLILKNNNYDKIIVENKDKLTRFGFNYIQLLTGNKIEVINETNKKDEDLINDLISIIHCFSCRMYGLRRAKNIEQKIKNTLSETDI